MKPFVSGLSCALSFVLSAPAYAQVGADSTATTKERPPYPTSVAVVNLLSSYCDFYEPCRANIVYSPTLRRRIISLRAEHGGASAAVRIPAGGLTFQKLVVNYAGLNNPGGLTDILYVTVSYTSPSGIPSFVSATDSSSAKYDQSGRLIISTDDNAQMNVPPGSTVTGITIGLANSFGYSVSVYVNEIELNNRPVPLGLDVPASDCDTPNANQGG